MLSSPDGTFAIQDELSGWFGAIEKYGGAGRGGHKDRAFWLRTYNGSSYKVSRVGRGTFLIPNTGMSLFGGIQPAPIQAFAADPHDDGMIQRLTPIVMKAAVQGVDEPMRSGNFDELVYRLRELGPPRITGNGNLRGALAGDLRFSEGAQAIQHRLTELHRQLAEVDYFYPQMAHHFKKYDGVFARLCIIWHCIEHVNDEFLPVLISEDTAKRVAAFLHDFLRPHAFSFYAGTLKETDEGKTLQSIAGFILTKEKTTISARDVQGADRSRSGKGRTTRQAEEELERLENEGWLLAPSRPAGRRDAQRVWPVNPLVHSRYAERRRREEERRAAAVETFKTLRGRG